MATTVDSRRETVSLIGSDKVEGTAVYGGDDRKIGSVQRVMIDKISGKAIYAVMGFGGFLGIGEKHHPLPWSALTYDQSKEGFVVNLDKRMLEGAPAYSTGCGSTRPGWPRSRCSRRSAPRTPTPTWCCRTSSAGSGSSTP